VARRLLALALALAGAVPVAAGCGGAGGGGSTPTTRTPARGPAQGHHAPAPLPPAPAQLTGAAARRAAIPILMYHVVSAPKPGTPNVQLWTPPARFRAQMLALRAAGYRAITLAQAWRAWRHGGPLPRRPIVISFDDGYLSHWTRARPVLRRLGWPGVLNLELRNVGPDGLPAPLVRGLVASGWEVDSHTIDHPDLTTVDDARLRFELVASRRALRRRFGVRADFFCYPSGRHDPRVEAAVRAAGYLAATTTEPGWARAGDDPYALPRVRVDGSEPAAALLAQLTRLRPA
jgi:peptidoglycan/xylan/chitin deacetylase (PgdA/CDA1 family)